MNNNLADSAPVAMTIAVVPNRMISYCWWALSRIIMLLQYDSHGVYHSPEVCMCCLLLSLFAYFIATIHI